MADSAPAIPTRNNIPKARMSLKVRILLSGILLNLIVLPFIGFSVNTAFEDQLNTSLNEQLQAHVFSVLSVLEVIPSSSEGSNEQRAEIMMPDALIDNQFNLIDSGLYAFIVQHQSELAQQNKRQTLIWQSASALSLNFENVLQKYSAANSSEMQRYSKALSPGTGQTSTIEIDIEGTEYIAYSYGVSVEIPIGFEELEEDFEDESPTDIVIQSEDGLNNQKRPTTELVVSILKNKDAYRQQLSAFTDTLWTSIIILMLILVAAQLIWLYWILAPLRQFSEELQTLERGESDALKSGYPAELERVATGLNSVIKAYSTQQQKYRNALADLAHSLKTPLAVIQSQKDLSQDSLEQSKQINKLINYQLNKTKVSTKPVWVAKAEVNLLIQNLVRTFSKLYYDKHLDIAFDADESLTFNGDEGDLSEILGNLIDNACKAAKRQVRIRAEKQHGALIIKIQDDGPGLDDERAQSIFERGARADTYKEGHGIGLAIVQDLVATYKGQLSVSRSDTLNGACFTLRFD